MTTKTTQKSKLKSKKKIKVQRVIKRKRVKVLTDEFYDFMGAGQWNVTEAFLKNLATRLVYWVENYEILTFLEFFSDHGVSQQSYFTWIPKCKELKEAHEYALTVIGTRRELGGLRKELEYRIIAPSMPMYSKMHKDFAQWEYAQKAAINKPDTGGTKYIIIDPIKPNSQIEVKDDDE